MITPKGDRIVFSTRPQGDGPEAFIVRWDGSGLTPLGKGFALAVWQNPTDGAEWIYLGTDNKGAGSYDFATVSRFPIDDPSQRELVWNKTPVSGDTFQVSADGRFAAGLFPWPHAGHRRAAEQVAGRSSATAAGRRWRRRAARCRGTSTARIAT